MVRCPGGCESARKYNIPNLIEILAASCETSTKILLLHIYAVYVQYLRGWESYGGTRKNNAFYVVAEDDNVDSGIVMKT